MNKGKKQSDQSEFIHSHKRPEVNFQPHDSDSVPCFHFPITMYLQSIINKLISVNIN